jgi:hypothetical protein
MLSEETRFLVLIENPLNQLGRISWRGQLFFILKHAVLNDLSCLKRRTKKRIVSYSSFTGSFTVLRAGLKVN